MMRMLTARPVALPILASLALVALSGGRAHAAPPVVSEGDRVRVESGAPSQATADNARAVAEAALALAQARVPYKLPEGRKIVVHLYPTVEGYEDALRVAGEGSSNDLSTTLAGTRESHVLIAPRGEPAYLARVGDLPQLTRYHVAYSTVSQMLRLAQAPSIEWWPAWYLEGLVSTIALDVVAGKDGPRPILYDDVLDHLREASESHRVLPVARLLAGDLVAGHSVRRIQAHWVALYRALEADPAKLVKLHERIRAIPSPLPPEPDTRDFRGVAYARSCRDVLEGLYGPVDTLDARLGAVAAAAAPAWFDVLRWSQFAGDELICAAPAGSTAMAISEKPAPGVPYSISCEMQIGDLGAKQGEIYFGYERRDDPRFLKVAFVADGFVTLLVYSDGVWQDRLRINVKIDKTTFPIGAWVPVKLTLGGGIVRVDVHDKKLTDLPLPDGFRIYDGRVGFGAFNEVAAFRKIVVAAVGDEKPPK